VSNHSLWIDLGLTVIYYLRKPTLGFAPFVVQQVFGAVAGENAFKTLSLIIIIFNFILFSFLKK